MMRNLPDSYDEPEEIEGEEEYQGEPLPQSRGRALTPACLKPASILDVLREHPRIIVFGDAGSGKTETALAFCREFNGTSTHNIGIHIPLKRFGDGGMDALINRYLGNALATERPLEKFGSEWNVALVCDGADECFETRREECIRSIYDLAKLNVRVIVLSRERGVPLDQLPAWTTYKLKAFDDVQRDAFLKCRLPGWSDKEHKALVREIHDPPVVTSSATLQTRCNPVFYAIS